MLYNPEFLNKILQIIFVDDFAHEKHNVVMQAVVDVLRADSSGEHC